MIDTNANPEPQKFDPRTVTYEDMLGMTPEQQRAMLPQLVNTFQETQKVFLKAQKAGEENPKEPDYSRLSLYRDFHDSAYESNILPISHAAYREEIRNRDNGPSNWYQNSFLPNLSQR